MANATMLTVATFGIAPGGYQQDVDDFCTQNGAVATANTLVRLHHLDGSSNYRTLADTVAHNLLGSVVTTEQSTLVSDFLFEQLSNGVDAGHLINLLADVIDNLPHDDPTWGRVATRFDNIHDLAEYYASIAGSSASTDLTVLSHYVEDVDDESSVFDQIKAEIDDSFSSSGGSSNGSGSDNPGGAISDDFLALQSLITLNTHTGTLSTTSLRAAVIAQTGEAAYNQAFDPASYDDGDGTLTANDLGLTQFNSLPATEDTIESLYYGTAIAALQSIDGPEVVELSNYVNSHQAELQGDTLPQEYIDLLISIFSDPGNPPLFDDATVADAIITGTVFFVTVVSGGDDLPLFDFSSLAGVN